MAEIKFTVDELRQYEFFNGINNEQVEEVADFLANYAIITYKALKNEKDNRNRQ